MKKNRLHCCKRTVFIASDLLLIDSKIGTLLVYYFLWHAEMHKSAFIIEIVLQPGSFIRVLVFLVLMTSFRKRLNRPTTLAWNLVLHFAILCVRPRAYCKFFIHILLNLLKFHSQRRYTLLQSCAQNKIPLASCNSTDSLSSTCWIIKRCVFVFDLRYSSQMKMTDFFSVLPLFILMTKKKTRAFVYTKCSFTACIRYMQTTWALFRKKMKRDEKKNII